MKLGLLSLLLLSSLAFGQNQSREFEFIGQAQENFELYKSFTQTRHRTDVVPDTCTRQVPYTDRQCRDVTDYEQRCRWRPGRQVCRNETRCRTVNGKQECRTRPVCRNLPGRRFCRQVPVTRNVCSDVTNYRTDTYACTRTVQVPYQVTIRRKAKVKVEFVVPDFDAKVRFNSTLYDSGDVNLLFAGQSGVPSLILREKTKLGGSSGDDTEAEYRFKLKFLRKDLILKSFKRGLSDYDLKGKTLSFVMLTPVHLEFFKIELAMYHMGGEIKGRHYKGKAIKLQDLGDGKSLVTLKLPHFNWPNKGKVGTSLTLTYKFPGTVLGASKDELTYRTREKLPLPTE